MPSKMLKADLHVHTNFSKDSRTSPKEAVKRAIELGFDAIAVCDHDTVKGSLEAIEEARGSGLLVIPGQEVGTLDGEIIVLGLKTQLKPRRSAFETMEIAKNKGGFIIVPHPFDKMRKGLGTLSFKLIGSYDAIEAFNSRSIFSAFNSKAHGFARKRNIPMTAGSDAHFPEEMGKSFMLIDCEKNQESIFKAIVSGKTELVIDNQPFPLKIKRGLKKIRTYF